MATKTGFTVKINKSIDKQTKPGELTVRSVFMSTFFLNIKYNFVFTYKFHLCF